jgi:hypothetical protein
VLGVAAMVGFVVVERRSRNPMLPVGIFASSQFTAANLVTFVVYAALGGVFFFLVLHLQVVAGFSPAGLWDGLVADHCADAAAVGSGGRVGSTHRSAPADDARPGAVSGRALLLTRVGADASYAADVVHAVVVFGLGLSLTVAPLTATVIGAADPRHAGMASGVNNAVARAAGLLAVAVLPLAIASGDDYRDTRGFLRQGFRQGHADLCRAQLAIGAVLASQVFVKRRRCSLSLALAGFCCRWLRCRRR